MSLVTEWPADHAAKWANFAPSEMRCKCGCGCLPDPEFMGWMQKVRLAYAMPMRITSAARCQRHNIAIKGATESMHLQGLAADIAVNGPAAMKLIGVAIRGGVQGLGLKQHGPQAGRIVHLDIGPRETPTCWTYP